MSEVNEKETYPENLSRFSETLATDGKSVEPLTQDEAAKLLWDADNKASGTSYTWETLTREALGGQEAAIMFRNKYLAIAQNQRNTAAANVAPEDAEAFLKSYNPKEYPSVAYTADIVIFTIRYGKLSLLLVERGGHPFKGSWALPGGFVEPDEDSDTAAYRELFEETGITSENMHLEQLKTYSAPNRDPRMRVITTAYIAFVPNAPDPVGGDDAADARFFAIEDLFSEDEHIGLAFDHEQIIRDGLERAASKLEYTPLATAFLEPTFTMSDLRRVYEAVWGKELHAANFRRKVLSTSDFVVASGAKGESTFDTGRTAELYSRGTATMLHPAILR